MATTVGEGDVPPSKTEHHQGLNWDRASEWITCICVVTFDLELGQALEITYPEHIRLGEKEKMNICFLSFPDSNSGCMGDTKFHIKVRSGFEGSSGVMSHQEKCLDSYNRACPLWIQRAAGSHMYGFVYFRQAKNAQLPRGYFQKSIVILTKLPFINFFYRLSDLIAPAFFQQYSQADRMAFLDQVFSDIGQWPSIRELLPQSSRRFASQSDLLHLKILNKVFRLSPLNVGANVIVNQQSPSALEDTVQDGASGEEGNLSNAPAAAAGDPSTTAELEIEIINNLQEVDLFRHLECIIKDIHLLWELVVTNEPIIVIGNSPSICSQVVQSLVSLISPLLYCGEVRPYFTIHDSEFREFTQLFSDDATCSNSSIDTGRRNCILGVTNPFFIKTMKDWPHTIRLDSSQVANQGSLNGAEFLQQSYLKTNYKRFLQKDKAFVKKIQNGIKLKRPNFVQTLLIQRHFHELTQSFLFPLERYLALLMPLKRLINPFKLEPPQPKAFNEAEFLQTIEKNGPQLTSALKGDWSGLYRRFLQSPNFKFWLQQRVKEQQKELQLLQLETLTAVDVKTWALGKAEVELVDLVLKIKQKLNFLQKEFLYDESLPLAPSGGDILDRTQNLSLEPEDSNRSAAGDEQRQRFCALKRQLLEQLGKLKGLLPEDLKNIL